MDFGPAFFAFGADAAAVWEEGAESSYKKMTTKT